MFSVAFVNDCNLLSYPVNYMVCIKHHLLSTTVTYADEICICVADMTEKTAIFEKGLVETFKDS